MEQTIFMFSLGLYSKTALLETPEACNVVTKETLAQVFSCEFWEISKNNFSYKTPLLAASGHSKYFTKAYSVYQLFLHFSVLNFQPSSRIAFMLQTTFSLLEVQEK